MNPQDPSRDTHPQPLQDRPAYQYAPREQAAQPPAPVQDQAPQPQAEPQEERSLYQPVDNHEPIDEPAAPSYAGQIPEAPAPAPHPDHTGTVTWTASEFVAHDKDSMWFAVLAGITVFVCALVFLITRDVFSTVVVVIAGILFGVVANRPPRTMQYGIDDHGVGIGSKTFPYTDFRSFSVQQEGPLKSITFIPLKRFMPPLTMYYDPADEDKIAEVLSAHLPMQDHKADPIEQLMKRIRF